MYKMTKLLEPPRVRHQSIYPIIVSRKEPVKDENRDSDDNLYIIIKTLTEPSLLLNVTVHRQLQHKACETCKNRMNGAVCRSISTADTQFL